MIHFSRTSGGIIVIDDIEFNGVLCTEILPTTTQSPLSKASKFELQQFPNVAQTFSDTLNCDFETDLCSHWSNEGGNFMYGFVPASTDVNKEYKGLFRFFKFTFTLVGNAAVALFTKANENAELMSQIISCAHGGRFIVDYYASNHARLSLCANDRKFKLIIIYCLRLCATKRTIWAIGR